MKISLTRYGSLLILLLAMLWVSCNRTGTDEETTVETVELDSTVASTPVEEMYIWSIDPEKMTRSRNPVAPASVYSVDSVIKGLNARFPEIQLRKLQQGHDTLYARIDNATYLTQQMGSSGPVYYMANVFFNLTAIPGIRFINLDFQEGDHAFPGVLSEKDFKDFKEEL